MSKQSEAKKSQGYDHKPVPRTCGTCLHYKCAVEVSPGVYKGTTVHNESDKRCSLGGFAVKKTATCNNYEAKR